MAGGRRSYTDADLTRAVATSETMREIISAIGLVPRGGNYETVRRRIAELGLDASHLRRSRKGRHLSSCPDDEVIAAVRASRSLAQVLVTLGVRPGGSQSRLAVRIRHLNLDTSHFAGQAWRRGVRTPTVPSRPLDQILIDGRFVTTSTLKKRLIEEHLKPNHCEWCLREEWNGRPIPLELDHVNGRRDDNRLCNLRVLCPNCHAQTETYRGKNIGAVAYSDGRLARVAKRQPRQA